MKISAVGNKVYLSGFVPTGSTGNIGTVAFNVSKDAIPCDATNTVANGQCSFQSVTLSGKYFSKAQQVISLTPASQIFSTIPDSTNTLTVSLVGTGSGTVSGTPPDVNSSQISCTNGSSTNCSGTFNTGTQITLIPSISGNSTFDGWSANCTLSGSNCLITLNTDTTVTATFTSTAGAQVQLVGTPNQQYASIATAYTNAAIGTSTIKAQAVLFTGDLLLKLVGKNIKLLGGYDPTFTSQTGYTTVKGIVTIQQGSLWVDRLIVK